MFDKVAEIKALGAIFNNADLINSFDESLFTEDRQTTFKKMKQVYSQYGFISPEGLEEAYPEYPREILAAQPSHIDPILKTLSRFRKKRGLKLASEQLHDLSLLDDPELPNLEEIIPEDKTFDTSLVTAGMNFLRKAKDKQQGKYKFKSSGFPKLDLLLRGEWPKKEVSIITADPGGSKTSLVCCSARLMATNDNTASLIISLEMSKDILMMRWSADMCTIDGLQIELGRITEQDVEKLEEAVNVISRLPVYVVDESELTIYDIGALIRRYVKNHGVEVVFIDYLQIIKLETDNKNRELGKISKYLKSLAKKLNIHICIISQKNSKEGVWTIRDSGDVPADVDILMSLVPADVDVDMKQINVKFEKNRNGKTGTVPMFFDGRYYRYE